MRVDGRGCEDYRCMELETEVVSNSSGSARLRLVSQNTCQLGHFGKTREFILPCSGILERKNVDAVVPLLSI